MRITSIFCLGVALHLSAAAFSQNVSLAFREVPLERVFKLITKQTGFSFVYNDQLIENSGSVSIDVRNMPLRQALQQCLEPKGLTFLIRYNTIIIKSAPVDANTVMPVAGTELSGVVKDERGAPLEGASVVLYVNPARRGTATDAKGGFRFADVPQGTCGLEVTMIGYARFRRMITVHGEKMSVPIQLKDSAGNVSREIVVNGIFQRPAQNYTGAAQSYTADQLKQVSSTNVLSALRSLDASFQMPSDINFGSDPNHLPQLQLRGSNSISGNNLTNQYGYINNPPLIILDGFEVNIQKIYDMDMGRVRKVTLLKDAAATSIYGSRAANGVLVIESVQPQKGKMRLSYSNSLAVTTPDLTSYHLLDATQKLQLETQAGVYYSQYLNIQQGLSQVYDQRLLEVKRGVNTYWLSQPLATEFSQKHNIFLDGGDEYMRYGVDLSYNRNTGVMRGSSRSNYSGGVNLAYRKGRLQFTNYLSVSNNKAVNSPYGDFSRYSTLNPYWRTHDSSGHVAKVLQQSNPTLSISAVYNPMYDATLNTRNTANYTNITENFQADWNLLRDLKLSARFQLASQKNGSDVFLPADAIEFATVADSLFNTRGSYNQTVGSDLSYQGDFYLNYGRSIGRHTVFVTAGSQVKQTTSTSTQFQVQGFPNANADNILFGLQYLNGGVPVGSESTSRLAGFFANASYAYNDRYLLDLSFRADGSSQFGTQRHFAPFWSVGAGWNLHKERFFREISYINRFKLRASYGSTGAQNFPAYAAQQTFDYLQGTRYLYNVGSALMGLGNPNLQWQQTDKLNVGTDLELLKGRLQVTANYYIEKTNNLFTTINTAPSSGFSSYYANLGNVENKGWELYVTAFAIKNDRENTYLSFYGNMLHNKNKLVRISQSLKSQNDQATGQQSNGKVLLPVLLYQEGQSMSAIYAVRSLGIDPSTGDEIFLTRDGQQTSMWNPQDEVVVGDNQPAVTGNFGSNLMYKGVSLNISMHTELGGDAYNSTLASMVENANPKNNVDIRVMTDRWKKPGDVARFKGLRDIYGNTRVDQTKATSRLVQKNNTLWCDAISFGYLFPAQWIQKMKMSRLQATFYINSPFVVSSINQERGLAYPFTRNYSFALQVGF